MRIAILGAPGSGKGAHAQALAARYRVPWLSPGELLRAAAADDQKLDRETREAVQAGRAVGDEVVMAVLEERLRARDAKRGFIIDGFPLNIPQAQALDTLLGMLGRALQIAVYVKVDDEALVKHITGRLECEQCGAAFNRHSAPPTTRGKCDECGGKLASRGGGTKAAAVKVEAYHEETAPLIAYYKAQHKMRTVPAVGDAEQVRQKIADIVDLEIHPLDIQSLETAAETFHEEINTIIVGGQINRIAPTPESQASKRRKAKTASVTAAATPATATTAGKKVAKKEAGKPAAKKTPAKTPVKKVVKKVAEKAAARVTATKKTATKLIAKKVAKKPAVKATTTKKTISQSTRHKKIATKTPVKKVDKKAVRKPVAKVTTTKKTASKSTSRKKTATKISAKKTAKKVARKPVTKVTKKTGGKKVTNKTTKKPTTKKTAKKPPVKKSAKKKRH